MSAPSPTRPKYCFSVFEVDPSAGELRRNGVRLRIQDQPFQVLLKLLAQPSQIVTREELKAALWPSDTFVDFDNGLNMAVKRLREALADDADRPIFIETVPRKGYRFIAPISDSVQTRPSSAQPASYRRLREQTTRIRWGVLVAAALLIAAVWQLSRRSVTASLPPMEIVPLLGLDGAERSPAFSPDGNQIALALRGEKGGIYVSLVSGGKALQLTSDPRDDYPTWSPNGEQIAFVRSSSEGLAIYAVPTLGGREQRVYSGPATEFPHAFDWSHDGNYLAISQGDHGRAHAKIALLSLKDSSTRSLTEPSGQDLDYAPRFSPDGSTVAFVRSNAGGMVSELYVVPAGGGEAKRLTFDQRTVAGALAWTPDGKEVLFSSSRSGSFSLWRVPASGAQSPQPVLGGTVDVINPAASRKGNQLAFQQLAYQNDIWRVDVAGKTLRQGAPRMIISAKGSNFRPQYSPDGKKIAFQSSRSGYDEIWVCNSDASDCNAVTNLRGVASAPRWSPDGKTLAFEYRPQAYSEIYVAELAGGAPRMVATFSHADNGGPVWSRDGKWIYFYSDPASGQFQIWKIPSGGGPALQVTKNGGIFGIESADGRYFYFAKFEEPGIWRMPLNGGEETRILDHPGGGTDWCDWALASDGIYFVDHGTPASLQFFEFSRRTQMSILAMERRPRGGLSISPDEKSLLFTQEKLSESRIVLVKNFH